MPKLIFTALTLAAAFVLATALQVAGGAVIQHQSFDHDPHWDALNNRLVPNPPPTVTEDFGYSPTAHAGGGKGEIGGRVQRSSIPAWYARKMSPLTLDDHITASGRFAVTSSHGGSGILFGFFNHNSRGWRTPNSLVFRLDGNSNSYWVFFEYGTRHRRTGGGVTFEGEHYQTTGTKPFPANGTQHTWTLSYDPNGANGQGQITFVLDGKTYSCALLQDHKQDNATFDRFGMFNQQTTGEFMDAYFSDLTIDGQKQDLSVNPHWEGRKNHGTFVDRVKRPLHDFGYSDTHHAGGKPGEIGGVLWRGGKPAYYGDNIGHFTLDNPLHASGKIAFVGAPVDSGAWFGFFNAKSAASLPDGSPKERNELGILIEGPSRIGHYFRPGYRLADGHGQLKKNGPVILPDRKVHTWSLDYDPKGAGGNGQITVLFDGRKQTLDLSPKDRKAGATFDHFGIFNSHADGEYIKFYLDDVSYTTQARGG